MAIIKQFPQKTTRRRPGSLPAKSTGTAKKPADAAKKGSDLWRRPMDLTPELASRLVLGLAENHRRRLELLVRKGGRASMVELLGVTDDSDLRVLSYFQGALSRKVRRLGGDRDKRLHLIGWDYEATEWNDDHSMIVNGVCFITPESVKSLRDVLDAFPASDPRGANKGGRGRRGRRKR